MTRYALECIKVKAVEFSADLNIAPIDYHLRVRFCELLQKRNKNSLFTLNVLVMHEAIFMSYGICLDFCLAIVDECLISQ